MRTLTALLVGCCVVLPVSAADGPAITAFSSAPVGEPPAAWKFATLPNKAATKYAIVELDGAKVLKVEANESYGNLVHAVNVKASERTTLAWRWRVDKLIEDADMKSRSGEDSAAKVCVSFAFDGSKLPFGERAKLALARSSTGEDVPTETLCYIWDNKLAVETSFPSVFTKRIRFIVLQTGTDKLGHWVTQRRNIAADHQRLFADESGGVVPDVIAVVVGADADNTKGHGLSYVGDLTLKP
ncbi:MAG TPA: DUF3047 domain-containing protein [Burkholderiaceae bacterium]|nr:DUF3047 domain-containing protein [Burkholderiaceae bacterium]